MWNEEITRAITEFRMIGFMYNGYYRIAEPHVYGLGDGRHELLCYQTGGTSSGGRLPEWRRFNVDQITQLRVLDERFAGKRETYSGHHSDWDHIFEVVR